VTVRRPVARDNWFIKQASDLERLPTPFGHGGVYFVPAFSGLYAPYWRADARGCTSGSRASTRKVIGAGDARSIFIKRGGTRRDGERFRRKPGGLEVDGGELSTIRDATAGRHFRWPVVRPVETKPPRSGRLMPPGSCRLGAMRRDAWPMEADKQWEPLWSTDQRKPDIAVAESIERTLNWMMLVDGRFRPCGC